MENFEPWKIPPKSERFSSPAYTRQPTRRGPGIARPYWKYVQQNKKKSDVEKFVIFPAAPEGLTISYFVMMYVM